MLRYLKPICTMSNGFKIFVSFIYLVNLVVSFKSCSYSFQCESGYFCNEKICRRDNCINSGDCNMNEKCSLGIVDGRQKRACFKTELMKTGAEDYCPGGGAVFIKRSGSVATCDLSKSCDSTHVCNPKMGVCCTKILTCPRNSKTMINVLTKKPVICQFKNGNILPCPENGYCEKSTGFCCLTTNSNYAGSIPKTDLKPVRGQSCDIATGCSGGAACICNSFDECKCDCPRDLGYTVSSDGKNCQRIRRRLKEKCQTDMECSAAFSECSSGGCRCKRGFKKNGIGGCEPIEHRCPNKLPPLKKSNKIQSCSLKISRPFSFKSLKKVTETNSTIGPLNDSSGADDCPSGYYCVPLFDDAIKKGYYKGFCCQSPLDIKPTCPVGEAHSSSSPPDYGCNDCPIDHYCHRDIISTTKSICCPKPCTSLEDIYYDGQCLSTAFYGDSCTISSQCVDSTKPEMVEEYADISSLECISGICSCPAGFSFSENQCKRIMCSVGFKGEPSVDKSGNLLRCHSSSDCSMGHMCDPNNHVCCRGTNHCPKNYVETGQNCQNDNCKGVNQLCHRTKNGKSKICCALENFMMDSYNGTTISF